MKRLCLRCSGIMIMLLMVAVGALYAQEEFSIEVIDIRKGLLSNFVTKTISDDKQFKYFATEAGISRYDGYGFRHYRPQPGDKGLENENIETLFYSKSGHIWIGTKTGGLSRLNLKTQVVENWNHIFSAYSDKPLRVIALTEDQKGNIWVGTWSNGCFKVDPVAAKVAEHFPSRNTIFSILCDAKGTIWYGDGRNLCAYRNESGALQRNPLSYFIYGICEDTARNRIWAVGANLDNNVKLSWYDQLGDKINEVSTGLNARFVSTIAIDAKMRIWLGSWGDGLYISNPAVSRFDKISTTGTAGSIRNINHEMITNIYIDNGGIAWLCTAYGGVLALYPNKGFRFMANNVAGEKKDYNVITINAGNNNELITGSISQGIYGTPTLVNPAFRKYPAIPDVRINQIYRKDNIWMVGASEGLYLFAQQMGGSGRQYFKGEKITSVLLSQDNVLWLGTQQHGLLKMPFGQLPDTAAKEVFTEISRSGLQVENNRINKLVEDKAGRLWVATHSGINLWNAREGNFISHKTLFEGKLAGVIVQDLLVTANYMYLATPGGLYKVGIKESAEKGVRLAVEKHYSESNALVNHFICAVQEDRNGNIWFSSTTGIYKLHTHSGLLHHFGKKDGVLVNAFHINSSFRDANGNIFFGGDNGLVFFNPEAVLTNYQKPGIVLTSLIINNQPVKVNDENNSGILETAIQYTGKISLNYQKNHIGFQFSANDYLGNDNISYSYKLEPVNREWVDLKEKNDISFSGLAPGKYTLMLRANRNNQGWGNPSVVTLHIAYPPWLKWYAWVFYAILITAIFLFLKKIRGRQDTLKTELQKIQFEKEKEHEINEAKINFFTNISHEFRTPLTLILSPSTELLENPQIPSAEIKKISLIKSNAEKLMRLINQLLDFRKSEHGLLSLRLQEEDLRKVVRNIVEDFMPAALNKKISLTFSCEEASLPAEVDKAQLEMAINNLLSNAIKFTPAGGKVRVKLERQFNQAVIKVQDSGIGIDAVHLEKIFNRFYQVPQTGTNNGGSGIGLAFAKNIIELHNGHISVVSTPGEGTSFTCSLPVKQAGQKMPENDPEQEETEESVTLARPAGIMPGTSAKPTILVVDDNEDIRTYLTGLLQGEFEILEAENGSDAYKIAVEAMPDLVISDVMMPQMDGIELCAELKHNMATSHIPVFLLTARASESYELSGLKTGADDYITKPFNPLIVQTRVRNVLESRKNLKAYYLKKVRFEPDTDMPKPENLDEVFLKKAIDLVNENIQNENLGIEMMVDRLFMSQSTLFRKIKSLTGLSITGFIRAIRLKKAAQLILQSNMKMSDVAYEVGFNDYKYFKKSFQQQFGCLPSEYREKQATNTTP